MNNDDIDIQATLSMTMPKFESVKVRHTSKTSQIIADNGEIVAPRPSKVSNIERKLMTKNNQDKKTISIEKLNKIHLKN